MLKEFFLRKYTAFAVSTQRILVFAGLALGVMFLIITIWGEDGILRLYELKQLRNTLFLENRTLLMENMAHTHEILNLDNPSYVEEMARSELGLIREDEVILVFPKE